MIKRYFKFEEMQTNYSTEIMAGITTFMTMAYIIFVNPVILSNAGMPAEGVLFATCLSSALATLVMGLYANYPFALAPGMGINAYFVCVCQSTGISWEVALGLVFFSGIGFLILTVTKLRSLMLRIVPESIIFATSVGIGLFIAFIGLQYAKIIVPRAETYVAIRRPC
ncbi:MAG: NCS2 family permease [bacterium]